MLFHHLEITGRRHPLLTGGDSRRLVSFVYRTLRGERPFCSGTGRLFGTSRLRSGERVRTSISDLEGGLGGWLCVMGCALFMRGGG